jgi:1-acylglycerol-3-phosphate O-acyltransferases
MMAKIRAFFYFIYCVITIALVVLAMKIDNKNHRKYRRIWAKFQRYFIRYKVKQIGEFDESADLIVINHRSMLDIIILEEVHPRDLAWVAKKEIGEIKILGGIISLPRMIALDRSNPRSIVSLIKDAKDRLANNRVIAIFPEGTRGRSEKMLKFQEGAKILATKLDLRIQPIVLKDTLNSFDVKNFIIKKSEISMKILPSFKPNGDHWYENLQNEMQKAYDEI